METEKLHELIVDYSAWGRGKAHVSKEPGTVRTLCGRDLGFNYSTASVSGREHDEVLKLRAAGIAGRPNVCRSCLRSLLCGM